MKTDYSKLADLSDKKLRTLRNNINNRLASFEKGDEKHLPPSHMLHGFEAKECRALLEKVHAEIKSRNSILK
jgi:hypothetical protein